MAMLEQTPETILRIAFHLKDVVGSGAGPCLARGDDAPRSVAEDGFQLYFNSVSWCVIAITHLAVQRHESFSQIGRKRRRRVY
ncbi:MAG TPA: hypothetical protein DCY13_22370 [Verrucomicrobiales bacterium]|nr:hypothetical protein [Verrucomicrobiales bacterium]